MPLQNEVQPPQTWVGSSTNGHVDLSITQGMMSRRIVRPVLPLILALLGHDACTAASPLSSWLDSAAAIEPWIIERQTELHRIPELMFNTPRTYAALEQHLTDIGVKHRCPSRAPAETCVGPEHSMYC